MCVSRFGRYPNIEFLGTKNHSDYNTGGLENPIFHPKIPKVIQIIIVLGT